MIVRFYHPFDLSCFKNLNPNFTSPNGSIRPSIVFEKSNEFIQKALNSQFMCELHTVPVELGSFELKELV